MHILSDELFYGHSEILSVWSVNDVPENISRPLTSRCFCVAYQPRKMGTKEMKAGHSQAAAIMPMAE